MSKTRRIATQIHTRELDRAVASNNMREKGIIQINKKKSDGSFFSNNWRRFVVS